MSIKVHVQGQSEFVHVFQSRDTWELFIEIVNLFYTASQYNITQFNILFDYLYSEYFK